MWNVTKLLSFIHSVDMYDCTRNFIHDFIITFQVCYQEGYLLMSDLIIFVVSLGCYQQVDTDNKQPVQAAPLALADLQDKSPLWDCLATANMETHHSFKYLESYVTMFSAPSPFHLLTVKHLGLFFMECWLEHCNCACFMTPETTVGSGSMAAATVEMFGVIICPGNNTILFYKRD